MTSNSNLPDERVEMAEAMEERGEYVEALQQWRELASDQKNVSFLCRQARLAEQLGYLDEAEQAFRNAIQIDDKEPLPYIGLASILMNRGGFDQAASLLAHALLFEKSPIAYTMLGVTLISLGSDEVACEKLQAAIDLDPTYEEAYFNLALIKRKSDGTKAELLFLRALEIEPEYADAHRELGWLLNESGQDAPAEYHIRRAIELKPNDPWAWIYLGNLLWKRGDSANAVPAFEKAISLMPTKALPIWALANIYESQESWDEASLLYERAIRTEPDDAIAHMNFGRMLKKLGNSAKATEQLHRALEIDPDCATARELLSEITRHDSKADDNLSRD